VDTSLVDGIRLHLAADTRFHGHPLFAEATQEASEALRAAPFSLPLRRVFFLAHAFVEIALDGWLIRQDGDIAKDFYAQFEASDLAEVVADAGQLLGREVPLLGLAHTLERFTEAQYLFSYAEESGMAEALYRVCHRAHIADLLADPTDRSLLGDCFASFLPRIAPKAEELLTPPDPVSMIQ
jgi:acyl carrier protein phosphodiesterase